MPNTKFASPSALAKSVKSVQTARKNSSTDLIGKVKSAIKPLNTKLPRTPTTNNTKLPKFNKPLIVPAVDDDAELNQFKPRQSVRIISVHNIAKKAKPASVVNNVRRVTNFNRTRKNQLEQ